MKPDKTGGEATGVGSHRTFRGGWGQWADAKLYADDFVVLAKQMSGETIGFIESRLEGKFQLEIIREKTQVVDLREEGASLNFLGYTFRYDRDRKGRNGST